MTSIKINKILHCNHLCLVEFLKHLQVNLLWHFWSTNVLAICPWQRISKNVCCDCPVACAKVNPSAMVAMKLPWTMLRISIILAAFPASPASLERTKLISSHNINLIQPHATNERWQYLWRKTSSPLPGSSCYNLHKHYGLLQQQWPAYRHWKVAGCLKLGLLGICRLWTWWPTDSKEP